MPRQRRRLLEQEIEELTEMLREDPVLEDLRVVLRRRKTDPSTCLLAGFLESEDGVECGVLVLPEGKAIEYRRRVGIGKQESRVLVWREVEDTDARAASTFPALTVALELQRA